MSRTLRMFLLAGAPFGIAMGLVNGISHGLMSGLGSGVVGGALFGGGLTFFMRHQARKFADLRPKYEPEGLTLDAAANLGGAGGWLFLTKQRLVFEPHKLNVGAKLLSIPLADITEVRPGAGKLVRRFEVVTKTASHSFLVEHRDPWVTAVKEASSARSVSAP